MEEKTLLGVSEGYYTEKRSEFFAILVPCDSKEEVVSFLEAERKKYPDARHYCYAYRFSDGSERAADDGEPKGTAGQPMLEVLRKKQLVRCLVIVTRIFGGVLLGASGLSRAYRAAAADAVNVAKVGRITKRSLFSLSVDYTHYTPLLRMLENIDCYQTEDAVFAERVSLSLSCDPVILETFLSSVRDLTAGGSVVSEIVEGEALVPEDNE